MAITKRKDTIRRPYKVSWREPDGRQRSRSFATLKDARQFHAQVVQAKTMGAAGPAEASRLTLADWLDRWFRAYGDEWARTTARQRAYICDKWVTPYIGAYRLGQLTPAAIRDYRTRILADGSTNKNTNSVLRVLSAALTAAVDDGLMQSNPIRGIRTLRVTRERPRALTPIEVERIRAAMPTDRDRLVVSIMAYAGVRPAEVCGLMWKDARPDVLIVERSVQLGEIVNTKTSRARTIPISEILADELQPMRGDPDQHIIVGDRGGLLDWHNWSMRVWRPAMRGLTISAVPYDLRHTAASLWLHEGRSLAWVSRALGHSSQTTTLNHYSHVYDEAQLATRLTMTEAIRAAQAALADR